MTAVPVETLANSVDKYQVLYRLVPPLDGTEFVVVSQIPRETMVFPADADGTVAFWLDMAEGVDHVSALAAIGYEVEAAKWV